MSSYWNLVLADKCQLSLSHQRI